MAKIFRKLHPSDGTCGICGLPWSSCMPFHNIEMVKCTDDHHGEGFFPVCEYCWQHESLDAILTAVRRLHKEWVRLGHTTYELVDMIDATFRDYKKRTEELAADAIERYYKRRIEL